MKKLLHNNKAFTLIEVITTITILSIIMAIAVGSIDGLVKNSKKKAMKTSASNYVDAINLAIIQEEIDSSHQTLEGSIYQEYMDLTDSLDEHSDVLIQDGKLQQANFCFEDGIVTYSSGEYKVHLNDDCKQSVVSDTITTAYNVDTQNKVDGVPVFVGDNTSTNSYISYEEEPYKLYMVNEDAVVSPTVNDNNNNLFCDINASNCDYRCIGGTLTYDEKGVITGGRNNCPITGASLSSVNQGDLSLSWSLSMGQSIDTYFWAREKRSVYNLTSRRHLDYITSSDGLYMGKQNPYLYKNFCNEYTYSNSDAVSDYCENDQTQNRILGSSSNYLKIKHIFMNGVAPYENSTFNESVNTTVSSSNGVKEANILDNENVVVDIKEYIKYGAVDFSDYSRLQSSIQQKINSIKRLLSNSSGVVILTAYGENFEFYNENQNIIYQSEFNSNIPIEQAMTIVGWDDNKTINGKRGAWIALTSNGNYLSDPETASAHGVNKNGYTYVSYYDSGYLSSEHYAFTKIEATDNTNVKVYSMYNSSYEHIEGSTSVRLENVVKSDYATNLVFDRIDSTNYEEVINQIKIYNQFSVATTYKVYLKQKEIYNEIGFVEFGNNEAGFKTINLNDYAKNIVLDGDKIDIVVTLFSEAQLENLVLLPEDFVLFTTKTDIKENDKIEIKMLEIEETQNYNIHYVNFDILTNNILTGEKIEFTAVDWEGKPIQLGGSYTTVVNDFASASINFSNKGKVKISINYNGSLYKTITVNASSNDKPRCSFSQSKVTVYEDNIVSLKLTCKDDIGIESRTLSSGLFGPLTINSYYAKIDSVSKPTCGNNVCTWIIKIEGNHRKADPISLSLVAGAVRDTNGLTNEKITSYITVK